MFRKSVLFVTITFIALASASAARAEVVISNHTQGTILYQFKSAGDPLGWSPTVEIAPGDQTGLSQNGSEIRFQSRAGLKTYLLAPGFYDFKETPAGTIELFKRR
jgi:hypothetical protein